MKNLLAALSCYSLFLMSCNIDNELSKAAFEIDGTLNKISSQSQNWQNTLKELQTKMSKDVKDIINNDLESLIQRSIIVGENGFKCDVEYVRDRISLGLSNLKIKIENSLSYNKKKQKPLKELPPKICNCSPIALEEDKNTTNILLSGSDLKSNIKLYGVKPDGTQEDISNRMVRPTEYSLNIRASYPDLAMYEKLRLDFPGMESREILVLPSLPVACTETIHTFTPSELNLTGQGSACPDNGSDKEFAGNGPAMEASVKIKISDDRKKILLSYGFHALESGGGSCVNFGRADEIIYQCDATHMITSILGPDSWEASYVDDDEEDDELGAYGIISKSIFKGDHHGEDINVYTGVVLGFAPIRIALSTCCDGCVPKEELRRLVENNRHKLQNIDSLSKATKALINSIK